MSPLRLRRRQDTKAQEAFFLFLPKTRIGQGAFQSMAYLDSQMLKTFVNGSRRENHRSLPIGSGGNMNVKGMLVDPLC
jgi:hypothetical protein